MSPNVEQPPNSATPSSGDSEAEAGPPRQASPRQDSPRTAPQWSRQAARPKSSPLRRSGGWDDGEALLVTDVEGEAAGVAGGGWGHDGHAWAPHAGARGAHDDGDDDEVRGTARGTQSFFCPRSKSLLCCEVSQC